MAVNDDDKPLATLDGVDVLPAATTRHRLPLRNADDVRKELARLYRQMKTGEIAPADGTKLAYVLNLLRQAIETGDLEMRLVALEQAAAIQKKRGEGNEKF